MDGDEKTSTSGDRKKRQTSTIPIAAGGAAAVGMAGAVGYFYQTGSSVTDVGLDAAVTDVGVDASAPSREQLATSHEDFYL